MKTASIVAAAVFSAFVMQGTAANAGQSCWGLQGQALQDCIDKLVDDLSKAGKETEQAGQQTLQVKKSTITRQKRR